MASETCPENCGINGNNNGVPRNTPSVIITSDDVKSSGKTDLDQEEILATNVADFSPRNTYVEMLSEKLEAGSGSYTSDCGNSTANSLSDDPHNCQNSNDFEEPTAELRKKIIAQVEYYFSDANVIKDKFLLRHIKRNKDGYVSLKLISSFNKVKRLTNDYRVLVHCLKESTKLILNADNQKVRRVDPLPTIEGPIDTHTVVVTNLPDENPTVESIAELFSSCGETVSIRILLPGKPLPQDIQRHRAKHSTIGSGVCAVVEFKNHKTAYAACEQLTDTTNWRTGLRVVLLRAPNNQKEESKKAKKVNNTRGKKKSDQFIKVEKVSTLLSSSSESDISQVGANYPANAVTENMPKSENIPIPKGKNKQGKHKTRDHNSKAPSEFKTKSHKTLSQKDNYNSADNSPKRSPWVSRRLRANNETRSENNSPRVSPSPSRRFRNSTESLGPPRMLDMSGVLRQPRGPDDTLGFPKGRGRGGVL